MALHTTCDGVKRRDFLKVGVLGTTGLGLSSYLRLASAGAVQTGQATSAIFVNLPGGPSHMDTFDLKPNAPEEYRGLFNPIQTNVEGIEISEHLPKLVVTRLLERESGTASPEYLPVNGHLRAPALERLKIGDRNRLNLTRASVVHNGPGQRMLAPHLERQQSSQYLHFGPSTDRPELPDHRFAAGDHTGLVEGHGA